jgi:hypothetical protein
MDIIETTTLPLILLVQPITSPASISGWTIFEQAEKSSHLDNGIIPHYEFIIISDTAYGCLSCILIIDMYHSLQWITTINIKLQ